MAGITKCLVEVGLWLLFRGLSGWLRGSRQEKQNGGYRAVAFPDGYGVVGRKTIQWLSFRGLSGWLRGDRHGNDTV